MPVAVRLQRCASASPVHLRLCCASVHSCRYDAGVARLPQFLRAAFAELRQAESKNFLKIYLFAARLLRRKNVVAPQPLNQGDLYYEELYRQWNDSPKATAPSKHS